MSIKVVCLTGFFYNIFFRQENISAAGRNFTENYDRDYILCAEKTLKKDEEHGTEHTTPFVITANSIFLKNK